MDALLASGVLFGDLVVNVVAIMMGNSLTFGPGKGVKVEKANGGESSLPLVLLEKYVMWFNGYRLGFAGLIVAGPADGATDCLYFMEQFWAKHAVATTSAHKYKGALENISNVQAASTKVRSCRSTTPWDDNATHICNLCKTSPPDRYIYCLELKTELLNKKDVVDKETYDKLCKNFTTLEKHCITLEADSQLNQEIFQQKNSVLDQNAPSFTQLFELSELRAQSQEKDTVIVKLKEQIKSLKGNVDDSKVKMDMDKIETLNIELEPPDLIGQVPRLLTPRREY
ncbi:hypothetical protein Tco_0008592 [Tanacetum coccineum]